ncbi:MAG: oligoendopeptidase F [Thermoanaerobaculales bacterium]|jgi:oligoendopeptidase F|nr:oligoendopeptidase F [Thermoanaerobaculales bacterium]
MPDPTGLKPTTRDRSAIPAELTWDLSHIFPDWTTWEAALGELEALMARYQELEGTLAEGPGRILAASLLSDELGQLVYRVYQYPSLMRAEDTRDNDVQARLERVRIVLAEFHQATAWYQPELLRIPEETMRAWLEATPELAPYRFGIEESYRRQRHVLDEQGERLLAYSSRFDSTPATTFSMMADADVDFPTVTLSTGEEVVASHAALMNGLFTRRRQEDREALFKGHVAVVDAFPNTYGAIYNGILQRDWFLAQARRYGSCLEADLDEDAIPLTVYERLVEAARSGVAPLRRYHQLRRRALGVERYRYFDAYLPLVEVDWTLPYREVAPLVAESVTVFGGAYRATVERAFAERWIDVYESEGKRSGAFSAGVYGVHPYMLLNYADTLNDAFTVAHEMGHTMHTVLANESQPYATSSYSIFVAEVASMTNEDLFLDLLLERETDPTRRVALLQHAIDDIGAGFYRQAMFADFEHRAHRAVEEGRPITAEALQRLYLGVLGDFFGDSLDDQDLYRNTWAQIPHFYGSPFYVFQYATSKAAASLLHRRMTEGSAAERATAVDSYLELLRAGGADHPIPLLRRAGVDFSTGEPVDALVATMERLVGELERALETISA